MAVQAAASTVQDFAALFPEHLIDALPQGFVFMDRDLRVWVANRKALEWDRRTWAETIGRRHSELWPLAVGTELAGLYQQVLDSGRAADFQFKYPTGGRTTWLEIQAAPFAGGLMVFYRDVSAERRLSESRELLMHEVDHRARNSLAMVQSFIRLTRAADLESYKNTVLGRISSLSRAQTSLARKNWEGADLRHVIDEELALLVSSDQYQLSGPAVAIDKGQVQSLSLICHELATNAQKHGALASPSGTVEVSWTRGHEVEITWSERGSHPVSAPQTRGFGSRLIEQLAKSMGATIASEWLPTGLRFKIALPQGS